MRICKALLGAGRKVSASKNACFLATACCICRQYFQALGLVHTATQRQLKGLLLATVVPDEEDAQGVVEFAKKYKLISAKVHTYKMNSQQCHSFLAHPAPVVRQVCASVSLTAARPPLSLAHAGG